MVWDCGSAGVALGIMRGGFGMGAGFGCAQGKGKAGFGAVAGVETVDPRGG